VIQLANNDFNVPRERRDTFQGMFDTFMEGFSKIIDTEIDTINKVSEAEVEKSVVKNPSKQEIHVHVHTEADVKETKKK